MTTASLSLTVVLVLCTLTAVQSRSMRLVKYSMLETCDVSQPCGWAVCPWKADLTVSRSNCDFVHMPCRCPEDTVCRLTEIINPDPIFITIPKKCQPKVAPA